MAQPTLWSRITDFVQYALNNPAATYNPSLLDGEFDAAQQSLSETRTNLGLIQRDDGRLRNGSVYPDTLSTATRLMFSDWNPRGAWAATTIYAIKDVVEVDGLGYVALVEHLSTASFAVDYAAAKWMAVDINMEALAAPSGSSLMGFLQSGVGAIATTVEEELRRGVYAQQFGVLGDGSTDDATNLNKALVKVGNAGGGTLILPPTSANVYLAGATCYIPDNVNLVALTRNTSLKLKNGANVDLIQKHASASGYKAAIRRLTIDGNQANNTAGGVYWAGPSVNRGPTLTLDDVLITRCRPSVGGGNNGAVVITGATWGVMRDVDIYENTNAIGLWHKASDWLIEGLFCSTNGNGSAFQNAIIQGGAGNTFVSPYFGGNGGFEQVLLWGTQRNTFIGAQNDNAWQHAWRLIASGGTESTDNRWIGGQTSSPGQSLTNTYNAFQFEGGSVRNIVVGQTIRNLTATVGKYAVNEIDTAGGNRFRGCIFGTDFGTATLNLRSGGGTIVDEGDGSAADPTYGFMAQAGVGFWRRASNVLSLALNSANYAQFSTGGFTLRMPIAFSSGDVASVAPDVTISRGAADVLELAAGDSFRPASASAQKLGDDTHTWRVYHDVIATASLPAAATAMNGTILIEDVAAGDRNIIVYAGGQRFRIDGGAAF